MRNIKAVIFDIDGTLLPDVSWLRLTKDLGVSVEEHIRIFDEFKSGKISYAQAKEELIKLWQGSGKATKTGFSEIFVDWKLKDDAEPLFRYLKKEGYKTALMTGSMDLFAEIAAKKVGVDHWYANTTLIWDKNGNLEDFIYYLKQGEKKLEQFLSFCSEFSVEPVECAVIGDGENDIPLFRKSEHGIAVESPNLHHLDTIAWKKIKELKEIEQML